MAVPSGVGPPGSVGGGKGPPRVPKPFVPNTGDFLTTLTEQVLTTGNPPRQVTTVFQQVLAQESVTPRQVTTLVVQVLVPVGKWTGATDLVATSTLSAGVLTDWPGAVALSATATLTTTGLMYRQAALPPDALLAVSGLSGSYTDIDDSPDAPDANHLTPTGGAVAVRMSFQDTGYPMRTLAGDQRLRVLLRYP